MSGVLCLSVPASRVVGVYSDSMSGVFCLSVAASRVVGAPYCSLAIVACCPCFSFNQRKMILDTLQLVPQLELVTELMILDIMPLPHFDLMHI